MAINNMTQQGRASTAVQLSAGGTETQAVIELDRYPDHKVWEHFVNVGTVDNVAETVAAEAKLYTFIRETTIDHILLDVGVPNIAVSSETITIGFIKTPGSTELSGAVAAGTSMGSVTITEGVNDDATSYFVDLSGIAESLRRFAPGESLWLTTVGDSALDDLGEVSVTMLGRNHRIM